MDSVDRQLLAILEEDARMSNSEIARRMGASESYVRSRLKKLVGSGRVRRGLVVDFSVLGIDLIASLKLRFTAATCEAAIENIASHSATALVMPITGSFQIFTIVAVNSSADLREYIDQNVRPLDGFLGMDISLFAEATKYDSRFAPLQVIGKDVPGR